MSNLATSCWEVGRRDEAGRFQAVHLRRVRREEDIGRGPLLHLAGEVARCAEREVDVAALLALPRLADLGQRIDETRCGKYQGVARPRGARSGDRRGEDEGDEKAPDAASLGPGSHVPAS